MSNAQAPSRRPRFSLQTVALLTAIIGLAITVTMMQRDLGPLREENRRLRDEVGELSISDVSRLHAIRAPSQDNLTWKWRLWLPMGHNYAVRIAEGPIPVEGFPKPHGSIFVEGKGEELWVQYRISQSHSGHWLGSLSSAGGSVGGLRHDWVDWPAKVTAMGGVANTTKAGSADQPLTLMRYRTAQKDSSSDIPDPADGFLVWVEAR